MKLKNLDQMIEIDDLNEIQKIKKHCKTCIQAWSECYEEIKKENIRCDYLYDLYSQGKTL